MIKNLADILDLVAFAAARKGVRPTLHLHDADAFLLDHVEIFDEILYHHRDGEAWLAAHLYYGVSSLSAYSCNRPDPNVTRKRHAKIAQEAARAWLERVSPLSPQLLA